MLTRAFIATAILFLIASPAQSRTRRTAGPQLLAGLGEAHQLVSTQNPLAQQFFDQGLKLLYGFNHAQARISFEHAAELDPKLAMAWWGIALTLGPNYNFPADAEREKKAYEAIQRAISLQGGTSQAERAYIQALAFRYAKEAKPDRQRLNVDYRDAMAKLVQQYPDDLNAATLYAESLMNLHPWQLWLHDGRANDGTEEIVAVLESVLARDPNHLGANHYYIHAVEASPHPERALPSALRLEKMAPAAGHLLHMPSHIYARMGDYASAAKVNVSAVAAEKKFMSATGRPDLEADMLNLHNLHFLAYAQCMRGDFAEAKRAADQLVAETQPRAMAMPMLQVMLGTRLLVLIAFERWTDILNLAPPERTLLYAMANWHFARSMAFAASGKITPAQDEAKLFVNAVAKLPRDAAFDSLNSITNVVRVQENFLEGMIAAGEKDAPHGEQKDEATEAFRRAIAAEDALNYNEPPSWFPPVRPIFAEYLLQKGKAAAAEKVFRDALERSPRYPRALIGLRESLRAQQRSYEAELIDQQLRGAQTPIDRPPKRHRK